MMEWNSELIAVINDTDIRDDKFNTYSYIETYETGLNIKIIFLGLSIFIIKIIWEYTMGFLTP